MPGMGAPRLRRRLSPTITTHAIGLAFRGFAIIVRPNSQIPVIAPRSTNVNRRKDTK
jgi:hypothetical protein